MFPRLGGLLTSRDPKIARHDYGLKAPICRAQAEEAVAVALTGPADGAILSSVRFSSKLERTVKPAPAEAIPVTQ